MTIARTAALAAACIATEMRLASGVRRVSCIVLTALSVASSYSAGTPSGQKSKAKP